MTNDDVKIIKNPGMAYTFEASDRTTSSVTATMKPGEPLKIYTTNEFVFPLATGDPEVGTDIFVGICKKESTETSTVDGKVEVVTLLPMSTVLRAKATTAANVDTVAEILALKNDWVAFDLTASSGTNGIFTIDSNEGDDPNVHGLCIIDGDPVEKTLDVIVHAMATLAGTTV